MYKTLKAALCSTMLLTLVGVGQPAPAADFEEVAKLLAADGAQDDFFALSVAVSGDTAVIGASGDDHVGINAGSAYVFTRPAGIWTQQAKLTAADGFQLDLFGHSVAVSSNTAVIGAFLEDHVGINAGSAYVFTRSAGIWTQQAKLTAADGAAFDRFGISVAVSGDTAVIGAPLDDDAGDASGSAYVFTRSAGIWTQQAKLTAADGAAGDRLGDSSVAVSGDTAVIGVGSINSAYVFTRFAGIWTQQAKLTAADGGAGDEFGRWVAVSGNTAVIGARLDDAGKATGSAYVFTRSAGIWTQQAKLTAADGAAGDEFGYGVAVAGDTALIGARGDDDAGNRSGSAYLFIRSAGIWTQQAKLTAADDARGDEFGISVAVAGDTAVIGAYRDDDAGADSGSAYVFARDPIILAIEQLIATVMSFNLQQGIENGLDAKLFAIIMALDDVSNNNDDAAINMLVAFIQNVEAQRGHSLTDAQADQLIAEAQAIIDLLNS